MESILNFLYAKKAWVGAIVALVMQFTDIVRQVIADEAITFAEAETVIRAFMALGTSLLVLLGVYKARNNNINVPPVPNHTPMQPREGGF